MTFIESYPRSISINITSYLHHPLGNILKTVKYVYENRNSIKYRLSNICSNSQIVNCMTEATVTTHFDEKTNSLAAQYNLHYCKNNVTVAVLSKVEVY